MPEREFTDVDDWRVRAWIFLACFVVWSVIIIIGLSCGWMGAPLAELMAGEAFLVGGFSVLSFAALHSAKLDEEKHDSNCE